MSTTSYTQSTVGSSRSRSRTVLFPALFLMAILIVLWLLRNVAQSPLKQNVQPRQSPQPRMVEVLPEQLPSPPAQTAKPGDNGRQRSSPGQGEIGLTMPAAYAEPADRAALTGDRHLRNGDWRSQYKAAAPQEPPVARSSLTEIRPYQDWDVHQTAADSLGRIGPAAVPALIRALSDADHKRRAEAAWLLGHIGPGAKQAVPALVEALNDPLPSVQKSAARALGQIGPDAAPAVEALMRLVEQTEPVDVVAAPESGPE